RKSDVPQNRKSDALQNGKSDALQNGKSDAPRNDKSDIQQLKAGQTAHIGARSVGEKGRVFGREFFFLLRQFVNRMKRVGGTHGNAGSAIDAALRVDVKLRYGLKFWFVFLGMNAVGRADVYAQKIFDAGVGNHIRHDEGSLNELESRDPCQLFEVSLNRGDSSVTRITGKTAQKTSRGTVMAVTARATRKRYKG